MLFSLHSYNENTGLKTQIDHPETFEFLEVFLN